MKTLTKILIMTIIGLAAYNEGSSSTALPVMIEVNAVVNLKVVEMKKHCSKCGNPKELIDFCQDKNKSSGVKSECKKCKLQADKIYRQNNKEKILERSRKYYLNNIEKVSVKSKIYSDRNKKKRANRVRNRRNTDSVFKLKSRLGSIISGSIKRKGYTKKSRTFEILGCNYDFFILHIKRQFTQGMTLANYGKWHLDHIIPISLAKSEKDVIDLNHYTNFQPLWEKDNLCKSDNVPEGHQLSLTI